MEMSKNFPLALEKSETVTICRQRGQTLKHLISDGLIFAGFRTTSMKNPSCSLGHVLMIGFNGGVCKNLCPTERGNMF